MSFAGFVSAEKVPPNTSNNFSIAAYFLTYLPYFERIIGGL
jgi:hypothetical protein